MASKKTTKKATTPPTADALVSDIIGEMNGKHGEGASMLLEGSTVASVNHWIPSGATALDAILGGGYPAGRVVEIYGGESNGKTTFALHALAETQKAGGIGIFLDTEHALSKEWAQSLGVDLTKLIYAQPGTMEELFDFVEDTISYISEKSPETLITIVWDSVASTPVKPELEGEYGDAVMGLHARVMSQAFRKITKRLSHCNVLFICLNQIRAKFNVSFGNPNETFGKTVFSAYLPK